MMESPPPSPAGMANMGQTCYLNTAIQCLAHCPEFLSLIIGFEPAHAVPNKAYFYLELREILRIMWINGRTVVPRRFISFARNHFGDRMEILTQNDMEEFLNLLIEQLTKEYGHVIPPKLVQDTESNLAKASSPKDRLLASMERSWVLSHLREYSKMVPLFYGQHVTQITCSKCNYYAHTNEVFSTLPLALSSVSDSPIDVMSLIQHYHAPEILTDWQCDHCKEHSEARKSMRFWRLPNILILVIKRFTSEMRKLTTPVQIPMELDLDPLTLFDSGADTKYQLQAIGCHVGAIHRGHYYAVGHRPGDQGWYLYDDDSVQQLPKETDMVNRFARDAYVMVYIKKPCT